MARFKLTLEYEGTRYRGWQVQKNARTVAGEIEEAVRRLSGRKDFELYGSGRTDAGVHALAQVAHLDLNTSLDPERLRFALNDELPADINLLAAERVGRRFHARHDAVMRSYLYQVSRRRSALAKPFVWWVKDTLDAKSMGAGQRWRRHLQCAGQLPERGRPGRIHMQRRQRTDSERRAQRQLPVRR